MTKREWSQEEVRLLKTMWEQHKTHNEIATALNRTEKMISGKCVRLGLTKRVKIKAVQERVYESATLTNKEISMTAYGTKKPLIDLGINECRWPIGDPRHEGFGYCGGIIVRGSYCEQHAALSRRKQTQTTEDKIDA